MTDRSGKSKKAKKPAAAQPSVLGSLPATRPERIGRRGASGAPGGTARAKPAAAARTAAAKPKPRPKATRATAASRAASAEKAAAAQRRAARSSAPPPPPESEPRRATPPKGPELVTTAIQAAGEIAHIGITVGGQVLKRAARRLPRP
jgi:hypothetical protein